MNLVTTTTRTRHYIELLSPVLWVLNTHFTHRTLLCPLRGCARCRIERPKARGYAIGRRAGSRNQDEEGLFEFGPDTTHQIRSSPQFKEHEIAGTRIVISPRDSDRRWHVNIVDRNPDPTPCPPEALANALEILYRLPWRIDEHGEIVHPTDQREWLAVHQGPLAMRIVDSLPSEARSGLHELL